MHNCKNKIATQFVPPDIRNTFKELYILASIKYLRIRIVQYLFRMEFSLSKIFPTWIYIFHNSNLEIFI